MLLGKKRKIGRMIEEITAGEKLEVTEKIEDRDLLLYLGLSNDNNPLFIQHDYASMTPFKKPIVPQIMLLAIVTGAISKYLPGPGSSIKKNEVTYDNPVYHYETVHFQFEVIEVSREAHEVIIHVAGTNEAGDSVLEGKFTVCPPYPVKSLTQTTSFDNF
ncbi:MaoC family dehydratase [Pseudalkalibacillus hwajinpoensis]|uniref:Enoyl-CoA hydratase n=1 Tax=Guptibacillus hwajinpoensis TaxID=208199 RepID=A0A4U1MAA8_9BACL|nr:MaoC/PaaZ C-terminal domain-containing protein [Pseudalkalibacillus hwajinpoensis]TKD67899.1 enoyl-CoA hydratase [Pseudalkalibacillus hwajinpoensis]